MPRTLQILCRCWANPPLVGMADDTLFVQFTLALVLVLTRNRLFGPMTPLRQRPRSARLPIAVTAVNERLFFVVRVMVLTVVDILYLCTLGCRTPTVATRTLVATL